MRIIFTISNYAAACHVGGGADIESFSVVIPNVELPKAVLEHLKDNKYSSMSVSYEREGGEG